MVARVCPHERAVGGDELDRGDAVRGEAEPPREPADSAAEGVAGDADVGRGPVEHGEPMGGRRLHDVVPDSASLDAGGAPLRVDGDLPQVRGAQQHCALQALGRERGRVVARALGRDVQADGGCGPDDATDL